MGTLAKFIKDPDETKRYTVSWQDWLDVGETIVSAVFETSITVGAGVTLDVTGDTISGDGFSIVFYLSSGTAGVTYKVTMRITTSAGQIKEDCIIVVVRNC